MTRAIGVALLALVGLAGCETTPVHEPDFSRMSKCEQVSHALTSPYADATTKAVAMEVGRNHSCFGQAPAQRIKLDHTVRVAR